MQPLDKISLQELKPIKMIVFDVDGVLVPRGTKIKQVGNTTTLETKVINEKQIDQIRELSSRGLLINISSGRGLYMLQEMFRDILPFVSLTYENGSATWHKGKIYQHVNSFERLSDIYPRLKKIAGGNPSVKGFEPKEFIITMHCDKEVKEIEQAVAEEGDLSTVWNGEAYDIQMKSDQTKAVGLRHVREIFKLGKENIMAIGDNYNDHELLEESGLPISADKTRVEGKFYVSHEDDSLPADQLMQKVLKLYA